MIINVVIFTASATAFKRDIEPVIAYAGGAMRLSVDTSNFLPAPKIAWNYRGKSPISRNNPRFTVLPSGVLQAHGLSAADVGQIRAIALVSGGVKANNIVKGKFQDVAVQAGNQSILKNEIYRAAVKMYIFNKAL